MRLGVHARDGVVVVDEAGQGHTPARALDPDAGDIAHLLTHADARARLAAASRGDMRSPLDPRDLLAFPARRVFAVGLNYASHAAETGRAAPDVPVVFAKLGGTGRPRGEVRARAVSGTLDYEAEVGVVVGATLDEADEAEAKAAIAGYLVANDLTLRDHARPPTLTLAKAVPNGAALGPWVLTADAVPDWRALRVRSSVNGEPRQDACLAEMIHAPAAVLAYASRFTTLVPGDVLLTGSPAGSGAGFEPPRWLRPGDVVRCEADGLGAVETRVV